MHFPCNVLLSQVIHLISVLFSVTTNNHSISVLFCHNQSHGNQVLEIQTRAKNKCRRIIKLLFNLLLFWGRSYCYKKKKLGYEKKHSQGHIYFGTKQLFFPSNMDSEATRRTIWQADNHFPILGKIPYESLTYTISTNINTTPCICILQFFQISTSPAELASSSLPSLSLLLLPLPLPLPLLPLLLLPLELEVCLPSAFTWARRASAALGPLPASSSLRSTSAISSSVSFWVGMLISNPVFTSRATALLLMGDPSSSSTTTSRFSSSS